MFAVGGGISVYEGVLHIRHPRPLQHVRWNYTLLAIAFCFESVSLCLALRELKRVKSVQSFWEAVRISKDPAVFAVVFEDSAAVLGVFIAFLGLYGGTRWSAPSLDGFASLLIGLLLGAVAILLARQTKALLVGEGAWQSSPLPAEFMAEADALSPAPGSRAQQQSGGELQAPDRPRTQELASPRQSPGRTEGGRHSVGRGKRPPSADSRPRRLGRRIAGLGTLVHSGSERPHFRCLGESSVTISFGGLRSTLCLL